MQTDLFWDELLQILQKLDIEIRWSSGEFQGGLYSSRGVHRFLLNEGYPREWQVRIICRELSRLDLTHLYLSPALRRRIERSRAVDAAGPELIRQIVKDG